MGGHFNVLEFIANHAGLNLPDAITEAYKQGKQDVVIDRAYCENALLFLWVEDVLTDGEYNRIMDKLKKSLI